ncbi:hypothetical protein [Flavobacterium sp.]|uniref:hypothetical protein n=1 Tax=Flavobacterium sp. TaxID=239 RepID=UPI004033F473
MSKDEFIKEIDRALENFQMSPEMREFLTNLKNNLPLTEADRFKSYTEWMDRILMTISVVVEFSKYT